MKFSKVIAIDGPSGSGKSTVAKMVASKLGHTYIDTGAMFRAIGLYFYERNIAHTDTSKIENELGSINFEYGVSDSILVSINEKDLTLEIRKHYVSDIASRYSKVGIIREFLQDYQRSLVQLTSCVMEGRDIGTVIFPNSYLKIFLTATDEVRALRRLKQLEEKGERVSAEQVLEDIKRRDERDSKRSLAPLIKADDAIELLTDGLEIDEVVAKIVNLQKDHQSRV